LKNQAFFKGINWAKLENKDVTPPFRPEIKKGMLDAENFPEEYTQMKAIDSPTINNCTISGSQEKHFLGFSFVRESPPGDAL
jgi:hypothetical protein